MSRARGLSLGSAGGLHTGSKPEAFKPSAHKWVESFHENVPRNLRLRALGEEDPRS